MSFAVPTDIIFWVLGYLDFFFSAACIGNPAKFQIFFPFKQLMAERYVGCSTFEVSPASWSFMYNVEQRKEWIHGQRSKELSERTGRTLHLEREWKHQLADPFKIITLIIYGTEKKDNYLWFSEINIFGPKVFLRWCASLVLSMA